MNPNGIAPPRAVTGLSGRARAPSAERVANVSALVIADAFVPGLGSEQTMLS
jgi:hypothetical protein